MVLNYDIKRKIVSTTQKYISKTTMLIIMNYKNLSSNELNILRSSFNHYNAFVQVIHNNLFKLVINNTYYKSLIQPIVGPTIVIYVFLNLFIINKLLIFYIEKYKDKLIIRDLIFDKKCITYSVFIKLSFIYTKEIALFILGKLLKKVTINRLLNLLTIVKNFKK